uniref:Uncharacterized protein n=1 Tax=Plectus sambesii TaxID=2011161 RepID=A0A914XEL2_9BILA
MYALLLPRAVQSTFDELSIAAQRNYSAILPLQERFNCCSVDYKPDLSNPEKIKRYEPVNVNFSCSTRSTLIMSKLVHSDEAWMVLKSQQPQKESCTEVLLSYFPGKTRWTWLLIAAAVPQTAFSWLFFFNCFFIACVWYERLHHAEESSPKTVGLAERRSTEQEHEREECIQNSRMRAMDESTRKLYYNDENDAPSEIEVNQLSIHKLTNNTRKPLQRSLRRKPMKEPEQEQQTDLRNKAMSDSYNSTTESEASPSKPSTAANKPILRFTEPTKLLRQHSLPESIEDSRVHADDISEENRRLLSGPRRESSIAMVSSYRKKLPHYRLRLTPDESMSVVTEEARTPTSPLPPSPSATTNDVLETDETSV